MICRHLDAMGRVVIPQEMREKLGITHNTLLDIALKGGKIIISKSGASCAVCGGTGDILEGTKVCTGCAREIAERLGKS